MIQVSEKFETFFGEVEGARAVVTRFSIASYIPQIG